MNSVLTSSSILGDAIKKLIVVDVSLRHPSGHLKDQKDDKIFNLMNTMIEINEMKSFDRSLVIEKLREIEHDSNVINFLLLNLVKQANGYAFDNLSLEYLRQSWLMLRRTWKEYFVPWIGETLFLKGERSDYLREDDEAEIKRLFPDSRIETVSKSGHWPHFDNQNEFINKVVSFL